MLDVLVLVVRPEAILSVKAAECIDEMRTQIRVDVLGVVLGCAGPVDTPVRVVTHHPLLTRFPPLYRVCQTSLMLKNILRNNIYKIILIPKKP